MTEKTIPGTNSNDADTRLPEAAVLVSATDGRGVITRVNEAFCELSGHSRSALVGAPHKILRHPDMPRAVFHAVWAELKAGHPAFAYIRNRRGDGGSYWVFAVISPLDDGYLSVQMSPQSDCFTLCKALYPDLLEREADGLAPDKSAELMLEKLHEAGFDDFLSFMRTALAEEARSRAMVNAETAARLGVLDELAGLVSGTDALLGRIAGGFNQVRGEPVNMRILAGRLEGAGATIGTISQNYDLMATEMHQLVEKLRFREKGSLQRMSDALSEGRFIALAAALLDEAIAATDRTDDGLFDALSAQAARLVRQSQELMTEITSTGRAVADSGHQLRRRTNGLDVVKLLCRVERGRMSEGDTGLDGIIARLEKFHQETDANLAELSSKAAQISGKAAGL